MRAAGGESAPPGGIGGTGRSRVFFGPCAGALIAVPIFGMVHFARRFAPFPAENPLDPTDACARGGDDC